VPTYQYACTACGHQLEAVQSFSDEALTVCPACEGRLRKVFSAVGIVFKGSGFYRTDSRADKADATTSSAKDTTPTSESSPASTTSSSGNSEKSTGSSSDGNSGSSTNGGKSGATSSASTSSSGSKAPAGSSA
jgi:putative FmdB family regulatory protein